MKVNESVPRMIVFTGANIPLVESLIDESAAEGYSFIQKTLDEWHSGLNRFSKTGEQLWGLVSDGQLVGIGGLNQDVYIADVTVGRVRHLYIRKAYRRQKQATRLLSQITAAAAKHFQQLRLFTDNPAAALFYEAAGFRRVTGYKVTHQLILDNLWLPGDF